MTVEVGAASYFWDPGRYFGLTDDLPRTGGKISEDRMIKAADKLKENIFHHFMGKVEIYEEYYLSEKESRLLELEAL